MAARNRLYIPNLEEFFRDFLQLIRQCNNCIQENSNGGLALFLGRCLEEYQRSLHVMYSRLRDYRNNTPDLLNDFEQILDVVSRIKGNLELLYSDDFGEEFPANNALCMTVNNGLVGEPRYELTQDQIQILRGELGFRWVDIAAILGISSRTLNHRRHKFGMSVGQDYNFSNISTEELNRVVSEILILTPQSGLSLVRGALRS
ncbi:Hypothetical predicted protein [Paramuricea clavata]|uniref:Uncharacterized protein n=1 Tax=Paramuricea clavata TaxID=317549 RepID=A0A6S7GT30_PARCT|nr:Hypothetical predicted protein [Paramuricea clavata]